MFSDGSFDLSRSKLKQILNLPPDAGDEYIVSTGPTVEQVSEELGLGLQLIEAICAQSDEPVQYLDDPVGARALMRLTELAERSGKVEDPPQIVHHDEVVDSAAVETGDRIDPETDGEIAFDPETDAEVLLTLRGEAPRTDRNAYLDGINADSDWSLTGSFDDRTKGPALKMLMGLVIVAVIGFLGIMKLSGGDPEGKDTTTVDPYVVGACLSGPLGSTASSALLTPCFGPHTAEILEVITYDSGATGYPGLGALNVRNYDGCAAAFESRAGVPLASTAMSVDFYLPSESSWTAGDRRVLCVATAPGGLTSPIAG